VSGYRLTSLVTSLADMSVYTAAGDDVIDNYRRVLAARTWKTLSLHVSGACQGMSV